MRAAICWYSRTSKDQAFEFNHLELNEYTGQDHPASRFTEQAKAWKSREWLGRKAVLDEGKVTECIPTT